MVADSAIGVIRTCYCTIDHVMNVQILAYER